MPAKVVEIKGFDELLKALEQAPRKVLPFLREAMQKSLRVLQNELAQYPPSSEANRPGRIDKDGQPLGYYERGRGWWGPIMQRATLGAKLSVARGAQSASQAARRFKVVNIPTVAGYKLRAGGESEQLGKSWATQISVGEQSIVGELGNNASYADWVEGQRQAHFHQQRGWPNPSSALEQAQPQIEALFGVALEKYLETLKEG
jgi:hypothetical protein